jgi:MinD superfamily P-loop ATPase
MTKPRPVPVLPAQGRRVAFIGKGGAGKSTLLAYLLAHWKSYGVPCLAIDTDVPGKNEHGTLYTHANAVDIGAPVYPAPAVHHIRQEAQRLCPEKGVCLLDTAAWEKHDDGPHLTVMSAVDKVILCLQPTPNELDRATSALGYVQQLKNTGAPYPELYVMLTMVGQGVVAADKLEDKLTAAGYPVLASRFKFSSALNGPAHIFKKPIKVKSGSPMDRMAREVLDVVAR